MRFGLRRWSTLDFAAPSMAIQRNPILLGRYAVADANDSLLTRVAIFSTSRSASFS